MTDFYFELGLDRNKKIDEINADLSRLESIWTRRQITNPEKATTMLALIIQAREVFTSDASRRIYDNELDRSRKKPEKIDPEKERNEALNKWEEKAKSYCASRQYDLAQVAIEKALSLLDINSDDDALFALAADIYRENGDFALSMNYINKAIVFAPDVSAHYLSKGLIYEGKASAAMQHNDYDNSANFRSEARKMFHFADAKAEQNGDLANRGRACGALAFSYYFYFQTLTDKNEGEKFANLAMYLGGDSWGNADKVLNAIREEAEAQHLAEESIRERERIKKEEEKEKARRIKNQKKLERTHIICLIAGVVNIGITIAPYNEIMRSQASSSTLFIHFIASLISYSYYRYVLALDGGANGCIGCLISWVSYIYSLTWIPMCHFFWVSSYSPTDYLTPFVTNIIGYDETGLIIFAIMKLSIFLISTIICWKIGKKHREILVI